MPRHVRSSTPSDERSSGHTRSPTRIGGSAQTEIAFKFEQRPLDASLIVLLLVLSGAVLCVACANVAGLLASRAPVRAREMSLRLAIGAGRGRLVRQLLTETLGIAIAGGAAGLAVAQLGIAVLRGIQFPSDMIAPPAFVLDRRALGVQPRRGDGERDPAQGSARRFRQRASILPARSSPPTRPAGKAPAAVRPALVAIQVALSLVLLTVSTFAFRMFTGVLRNGPGFRTTQIAKVTIDAGQGHYRDEEAARFFAGILEQARALPGVRSASLTSAMPLFSYRFASVIREGEELPDGQTGRLAWAASVDDQYFTTMNIAAGCRPCRSRPQTMPALPGVAILNTVMARQLWPDGDAIGQRLQVLDQAAAGSRSSASCSPPRSDFPASARSRRSSSRTSSSPEGRWCSSLTPTVRRRRYSTRCATSRAVPTRRCPSSMRRRSSGSITCWSRRSSGPWCG